MRILACVPTAFDATSYYRAYGIFPDLKRQMGGNIDIMGYVGRNFTWAELSSFDILFMQRPSHPDWLSLAKYCKSLGLKIWIDHDDNLMDLPVYNRVYDTYTPKIKQCMVDMIKLADVLTVSTQALREFFATFGVESEVVPNALNAKLTPMAKGFNESEKTKMIWRGSDTHLADLYFVQDFIHEAMEKDDGREWNFLGFNPWFITMTKEARKWKYQGVNDIMVYYENLNKLKGQLMHVPLIQDGLNKCKSNIAWIEATAAGCACIAPDWTEWQRPGVINYTSFEHYGELLMNPPANLKESWEMSRDYINENLLLSKVNKQRVAVLQKLMQETTTTDEKYDIGLSGMPATMIE